MVETIVSFDKLVEKQNKQCCHCDHCHCSTDFQVGDVFIDRDKCGKDRSWAYRKQKNQEYAQELSEVSALLEAQGKNYFITQDKLKNVSCCGEVLMFRDSDDGLKLEHALLCKDKLCPICAWRRSRKNGQIMRTVMSEFVNTYPTARYLHITLSAKNCKGQSLSDGFKELSEAWNRLKKYKKVDQNLLGFIRGTEVTYNAKRDDFNQHLHVLLAVKSTYFKNGDNYIKQSEWRELWQRALKVDYLPVVHVQVIKEKETKEDDFQDLDLKISKGLFYSILEVCKYPLKPLSLPEDFSHAKKIEVLSHLVVGLYRKRQMGFGGEIKRIKRELEAQGKNLDEDDLVSSVDEKEVIKDSKRVYVRFYGDFYKVMSIKKVTKEELLKEKDLSPEERFRHLTYDLYKETEENSG